MEGWEREMWYDDTGLPWVMPSPNMPTLDTATVYPGMCLLEGTNLSEGRGTTRPFEIFGAPWIDGRDLTRKLNRLDLPGVRFREAGFEPTFQKHAGAFCQGAQIHVLDRNSLLPFRTGIEIIDAIRCAPETPRHCAIEQATLSEIRGKIEKQIKNTFLKRMQAPIGVRPILKAWMELN